MGGDKLRESIRYLQGFASPRLAIVGAIIAWRHAGGPSLLFAARKILWNMGGKSPEGGQMDSDSQTTRTLAQSR
jgi:hypothetical protein